MGSIAGNDGSPSPRTVLRNTVVFMDFANS